MKKVKYDGSKWILITENGGFFNPNEEVFFFSGDDQKNIAKLVNRTVKKPKKNVVYEVPDSGIYTSVCGPRCGPFWTNDSCGLCGGNGVGASFDDHFEMQMGGTDIGNDEVQAIKDGNSNIHPELS